MRTKVEKRRVRHDIPSGQTEASIPEGTRASNSTLLLEKTDAHRDIERRPVSLIEAEKLAAANHVVVALGPPVVVGPSRVVLDHGKHESGMRVSVVDMQKTHLNVLGGGAGKSDPLSVLSIPASGCTFSGGPIGGRVVAAEEKAIRKPPKKRRNSDKRMEVALDLSTHSVAARMTAGHLPSPYTSLESVLIHPVSLPLQLQQQPITPPTPSPQHQPSTSPQHTLQHGMLFCRSPPNPAPLLQQTPPSSSEPLMVGDQLMDLENYSMYDRHHTSSSCDVLIDDSNTTVTPLVLSDCAAAAAVAVAEQIPGSELVLSDCAEDLRSNMTEPVQPKAVHREAVVGNEKAEIASSATLQPATWLLTPQENSSPSLETVAAYSQTSVVFSQEVSVGTSQYSSSSKKNGRKAKTSAAKSQSKSVKSKGKRESVTQSRVDEPACEAACAVVAVPEKKHSTTKPAPTKVDAETSAKDSTDVTQPSKDSKSKGKKRPQATKKPVPGDEESQERLQKIEFSIDSVIAHYVYDCDDISKLPGLRAAARKAEMLAESERASKSHSNTVASHNNTVASHINTVASHSNTVASQAHPAALDSTIQASQTAVLMQVSEHIIPVVNSIESQPSVCFASEKTPSKAKKKSTPKKKNNEKQENEQNKIDAIQTDQQTECSIVEQIVPEKQTNVKSQKKKHKNSKKIKAEDCISMLNSNSLTSIHSTETDKSVPCSEDFRLQPSDKTLPMQNVEVKSPTNKKKRPSKKKKIDASVGTEEISLLETESEMPNGHIEIIPDAKDDKPVHEDSKSPKKKKLNNKKKLRSEDTNMTQPEKCSDNDKVMTNGAPVVDKATAVPEAKAKSKKAKKRKTDDCAESRAKGNTPCKATAELEKMTVVNEELMSSEVIEGSRHPPKKKKAQEVPEKLELTTKKSPPKSQKRKLSSTEGGAGARPESENTAGISDVVAETAAESSDSPPSEEGGSSCDATQLSAHGESSAAEKKVKKTLDEVVCLECGHKTRGQAALSRHMKKMHEMSVVLPYPCPKQPDCEYSASKVSLLARHMLTHSLYMCSRCQFTVATKDLYEEHLQTEHNVNLDSKLCKRCNRYVKCDVAPMEKHLEVCQGPVPLACDVCGKLFKYESSLKVHHHTHFPERPKLYKCQKCDYSSNYRANLHKHVQNMHVDRPRDIPCVMCDKMFSTEDNMRRHLKIHTQVRPFKCDKCDKAFKSPTALRGHIVSHEVARPFKCNIGECQREFRTKKFLKSHKEEFHRLIPKRYKCPVDGCKFSFFKLSHLKRHEISHTGERNFHCDFPGCGKSFRHSDNLKVHYRQHTDERPIHCSKCNFKCKQKTSLRWHMKKIHNIDLPPSSFPGESSGNTSFDSESAAPTPAPAVPVASEVKIPEGFKLPEGINVTDLLPMSVDGVEMVEIDSASIIFPASEGQELPVTITPLPPVTGSLDLYEFHSDNDSSDEATPGIFKRDRTKMASAAPLPPAPRELLLKNSILDVLEEKVDLTAFGKPKKKKTPKSPKTPKAARKEVTVATPTITAAAAKDSNEKEEKAEKTETEAARSVGIEKAETKKKRQKKTQKKEKKKNKAEVSPRKEEVRDNDEVKASQKDTKACEKEVEAVDEKMGKESTKDEAKPTLEGDTKKKRVSRSKKKKADKDEEKVEDSTKLTTGTKVNAAEERKPKKEPKSARVPNLAKESPPEQIKPTEDIEVPVESTTPTKSRRSSSKKKKTPSPLKQTTPEIQKEEEKEKKDDKMKEDEEVAEDDDTEKMSKGRSPARGGKRAVKSSKSKASPKSPKGKSVKAATPTITTRRTPPRAVAKKGIKTAASAAAPSKKAPAKKATSKKKASSKKKSPARKKSGRRGKQLEEEVEEEEEEQEEVVEEEAKLPLAPPRQPKEKFVATLLPPRSSRRVRETRNSAAAMEEASSPFRSSSAFDSEEENMPQGAGSPYREFDSQDMDDSSSEPPKTPTPPVSPVMVVPELPPEVEEEAEMESIEKEIEEEENPERPYESDVEDIINDIPLTPPRAPAPPPQESSDDEMIPSPPTHMPMSADTTAPSSVMTEQPGSQAPDYQQPLSHQDFQQPHSHQDLPQPMSHQDFPQQHSREDLPQPLSQQPGSTEYPQHHSREEMLQQQHSHEEFPQHASREDYPQHHSREEYPQHHSVPREDYPQHHSVPRDEYPQHRSVSREEYPQHHSVSREEYPQHHSVPRDEYPQHHSVPREEYPQHHSVPREEYPQHHSVPREEYPQHHSVPREEYPQHHSVPREEYPQHHSVPREEYPQHHSVPREEYPQHHSVPRDEYPQHHSVSREEYPQHHSASREDYPPHHSRDDYPQHHSREDYPQHHSREEYPQHLSREEYPQHHSHHSREEYPQHHSREELLREELQAQGSVPEAITERPVASVHSDDLPEEVTHAIPHSVVQYDPSAVSLPSSEAESAYQYLQGLAQSGETISDSLAGEPSRLQQLEALAHKPHDVAIDLVKSPVGAPTSVITAMSPSASGLHIGVSESSSHRRMDLLPSDRQVEQALLRDTPSALPRLPDGGMYDAYSASNLFPTAPPTPSFMRLSESEAMLQRQRMTTPFLAPPGPAQPPERSLSRMPDNPLQTPANPSTLLQRPPSISDGMFSAPPGMPQAMSRNPFNTWGSQDVRPSHWGQAPTYLQRPSNTPTAPFPFAAPSMFDPTVRSGVTDRNMFASLSGARPQAGDANPFPPLDRFDLSTYFGSHAYSASASSLDYSRGAASKTFDERYRQTAASMGEFRPLPSTTSSDMFPGIGVGVNSGFNLDKYAMYGRDSAMYAHAAAQQLSDNTNSAFLTHATPAQHPMFDRDYTHRGLYHHQNPAAYGLFNDRQYSSAAAAKLTGHPTASAMSQERDFMTRPAPDNNQMQDPYRCNMLYNVMNRYTFGE